MGEKYVVSHERAMVAYNMEIIFVSCLELFIFCCVDIHRDVQPYAMMTKICYIEFDPMSVS
jgi:hypothetical protein